jgi:hypothetical protein
MEYGDPGYLRMFRYTIIIIIMKNIYHTKTEAIIDLQERGYVNDFILQNEYIHWVQQSESICPDAFEIMEAYRIDDKKRICDNCIIYAIWSLNSDLRGILMTPCSTLSNGLSIHLWSKLANSMYPL